MRTAFALLFSFCLLACTAISSSVPGTQLVQKKYTTAIQPKTISSLKVKDLERMAGRKFTLKEKLAYLLLKKKLKHQEDSSSREGKTAFSFGLAGIAFLLLGLFIPYLIVGSLIASIVAVVMGSSALKKNPDDRKAHSGRLLGWITLGLFGLLLILIAIILSGWGW